MYTHRAVAPVKREKQNRGDAHHAPREAPGRDVLDLRGIKEKSLKKKRRRTSGSYIVFEGPATQNAPRKGAKAEEKKRTQSNEQRGDALRSFSGITAELPSAPMAQGTSKNKTIDGTLKDALFNQVVRDKHNKSEFREERGVMSPAGPEERKRSVHG